MKLKELFGGVYLADKRIVTKNLMPGLRVYDEELVKIEGTEYRSWTPYRSKLSAAVMNGLKNFMIREGSHVLYLGASTGTTPSHVSDIIGAKGRVYCIEFSERSMRDLLTVCEARGNMLPILEDARNVDNYAGIVEQCDIIYQDVSAREQAEILKANSRFLKKGGYAYFAIKSQSIDVSKAPKDVYKAELEKLTDTFEILERISLEPYDNAHLFVVLRKK